jgi:tetratricopeptide (TPR) repeat protein
MLGDEAPETLKAASLLAGVIERQGYYKESEQIFREVLETQTRILGEEHPDTLLTMDGLAISLWRQGLYREAEELHLKVLETQRRVQGEDHIDTLKSMVHLGTVYWHMNRLDEAESWLGEALERERRVLGEQHPETLKVMNNLSLVLEGRGLYGEAEELLRETVDIQRVVLGYDHPDYVRSLNNLSRLLKVRGKENEAREITAKRIEAGKAIAQGSETNASTLNSQAWFLLTCEPSDLQDPVAALPMARRAADLSDWENPDILDTLALAYHRTGDLDNALDIQRRAVLFSASEGSVDPAGLEYRFVDYLLEEMGAGKLEKVLLKSVAALVKKQSSLLKGPGEILFRAGKSQLDQNQFATAERLLKESLDLRAKTLPEGHMHIVACQVYLGAALAGQEKYEDAEWLLLEAINTLKNSPEPDKTLEYQAFLKIINLYAAWGKPDQEEAWLKKLK